MAPSMKASFALNLGGDLKQELKKVTDEVINLKNAGKQVALEKLEKIPQVMRQAEETIRQTVSEVRNLVNELRTVEGTADRAGGAMRRLASIGRGAANFGKRIVGEGGLMGAAQALGGAAALIAPTRAYAGFENINRHIAITEGLSGAPAAAEAKRLMKVESADAIETAQPAESIAQALQDLIQTGIDPKRAEALLPIHSRAATAYNISPEALGHAVFALSDSFKIDETGMGGALASMALASKAGRFKVEDFSHYLPGIGGDFSKLGMTGRGSADIAFASLETVMKNAADPSQGAANFKDFMNALTSPHSARSFALDSKGMASETKSILAKYHVKGINLPKLLEDARNKGIDPLTAVIRTLSQVTNGLPPDVRAEVLGAYLGNQQARDAAQSLISHPKEYKELLGHLHSADTDLLDRDYNTARDAPQKTLDSGEEVGKQLERRIGEGFEPVVTRLTEAGKGLLGGIEQLDGKFPGLADAVLMVTGGMLALGSALAAIGFIAPAIAAGYGAVATGVGLAATPFVGITALPFAVAGLAKLGSDAETPANRAAQEQLSRERRSLDGGPDGGLFDGFGPDGLPVRAPINFNLPSTDIHAPLAPNTGQPVSIDLTVHTDSGTTVRLNQSAGGNVKLNPGSTTDRP